MITKDRPSIAIGVGNESFKNKILPNKVKITSPDWVDSIIANLWLSPLTKSVALKNSTVAIIPEKLATIKDCSNWDWLGRPTDTVAKVAMMSQKGRLQRVMPKTLWVVFSWLLQIDIIFLLPKG